MPSSVFAYVGAPYARAASFIVRAAGLGGRAEAIANRQARTVVVQPRHQVSTRYGDVPARLYVPEGTARRTVLLVPGIHSMGIEEPRLTALADDLAGAGVKVMAMALPDLQAYRITPRATDVIEDAVTWMSARPDLAPDGRVGIVGISFAGGLSISAASRPAIRDKVAFVRLVRRPRRSGSRDALPHDRRGAAGAGLETHPPHDYGVAVILYGLADRGVVPADQVAALREGHRNVSAGVAADAGEHGPGERHVRQGAGDGDTKLPEPSRTFLNYVNDRAVSKLGPALVPYLQPTRCPTIPALSPQQVEHPASAASVPAARQ